jgi:dTDP-4-amino-4,6-dideoxygalactose transaminase
MNVPLVDLQAQYRPLRDEILAAVARVCDSQRFILGAENQALEDELARVIGVEHALAVSSGTDALSLALMAVGIKPGDEVITSTFSFFATAGSIVRAGARPVLIDIDPATFNIDPSHIAAAITPRTRAILPVHLFGLSADLDPILAEADRRNIPVIEDAAQAIGSTYKSRAVGGFGICGCFSFFPSKNLGAFGEAGLLTTNDAAFAARARLLRNHGMDPKYHHRLVGGNFRMDEIQAAVLRVKAPHLAAWNDARRLNAQRYARLFGDAGLGNRLVLPVEPSGCRHTFHQFVVRTAERDALKEHLDGCGIGSEIYYPVPFHRQACFADLGYRSGSFPEAERAAAECLALPIYAELTVEQQQAVVGAVSEFFETRPRREGSPAARPTERAVPPSLGRGGR